MSDLLPDAGRWASYAASTEGVFLPHALWNELLSNVENLARQNEKLLLTVADLLAAPPPERYDLPDPYDLRALQTLLRRDYPSMSSDPKAPRA